MNDDLTQKEIQAILDESLHGIILWIIVNHPGVLPREIRAGKSVREIVNELLSGGDGKDELTRLAEGVAIPNPNRPPRLLVE